VVDMVLRLPPYCAAQRRTLPTLILYYHRFARNNMPAVKNRRAHCGNDSAVCVRAWRYTRQPFRCAPVDGGCCRRADWWGSGIYAFSRSNILTLTGGCPSMG